MQVVLNRCYGGFGINRETSKKLRLDENDWIEPDDIRYNQQLISLIKQGFDCNDDTADLNVFTIPDNCEHFIYDYDGIETLLYVFNGKIFNQHHTCVSTH